MSTQLTKRQLKDRLEFTTDAQVAEFFNVTPAAVCQWPEDAALPQLRVLQAERKRPDIFSIVDQAAPVEAAAQQAVA